MEANSTVMSKELQISYGCVLPQHLAGLEWQAEISVKAARKEVVEWLNSLVVGRALLSGEPAKAKLKEWEIEGMGNRVRLEG